MIVERTSRLIILLLACLLFEHYAYAVSAPYTQNNIIPVPNASIANSASFVSHQIIVKFKDTLTAPADVLFQNGKSFASALPTTDSSLDQLIKKYRVLSIKHVFPDTYDSKLISAISDLKSKTYTQWAAMNKQYPQRALRGLLRVDPPPLYNIYIFTMDPLADEISAAAEFAKNANVAYAHPNFLIKDASITSDNSISSQGSWGQKPNWGDYNDMWALKKIQSQASGESSLGLYTQGMNKDNTVIVAIVDTGIDYAHPEIKDNIWKNPNPGFGGSSFIGDTQGWNFIDNNNNPMDNNGHGTQVAGIIAAEGNNDLGVIGVAPQVKIMPVKALDATGSGTAQNLAEAIKYAVDHGADIINNSWSCNSDCPSAPLLEDVLLYAQSAGVVTVFAAGNTSEDIQNYSPQNTYIPIVVSAYDDNDAQCGFSNYGLVDIAAPGCGQDPFTNNDYWQILSLKSSQISSVSDLYPYLTNHTVGGQFLRLGGSSMSAAFVSGAAALLLANNPTWNIEQVREALRQGTDDVDKTGGMVDTTSGYGRLDLSKALNITNPTAPFIMYPTVRELPNDINSINVRGIADGDGFQQWTLDYGYGTEPLAWTTISSSTVPVPKDGTLATWNIGPLNGGDYVLRLTVTTSFGTYTNMHHYFKSFAPNPYTVMMTSSNLSAATINPIGTVGINPGADQTFTISVNPGYSINQVLVDGDAVTTISTSTPNTFIFTLSNVSSSHSITANFSQNQ